MPVVQFATNSYQHQSLPISSQRMVNCYAEKEPQDAKSPVAIVNLHGMTSSVVLDGGPIRGMHVMQNNGFVVSGGTLYSITTAGATALGGTIAGSGPVVMADDGNHIVVVNGVNGYVWSSANGFQVISDPNFHPSSSVTFFDNVFVFVKDGTNQIFISNNLDPTTYNGLAFATAQVSSAPALTVVNQQENLLIFCRDRIETWYDAGAAIFPFQPVLGATVERGCAAKLTPVKEDNSVFFLGDDLIFYRLDYGVPRRVSTHAIEDAWRNYTTVTDAFTFSYSWEGHKFIVMTFPSGNATWVYDIATGLWHERESWDQNNNSLGRWRGNSVANFNNLIFFGDAFSGNVGQATNTVFTELGNTMRALMVGPPMHQDRRRLFHSVFELDMETGVGNTVDPGSNPQVMLDWSDDEGRTFVPMQPWSSLGKIGKYRTRVRWTRLGQSRDRRYRVQISDPVPKNIMAAHAFYSLGQIPAAVGE